MKLEKAVEQEWAVFKALCPQSLLDLIEDPNISFQDFQRVTDMFFTLGFEYLTFEFTANPATKWCRMLSPEGEFSGIPYIRLFLDNLASQSLRSLFESKADYHC